MIHSRPRALRPRKRLQAATTVWILLRLCSMSMSMKSMNEYSIWYQLWAPLVNVYESNLFKFSINVGKISQDSWFYFTKQVSFWMRDDSLWANGAKVWLYISGSFLPSAAVGTFSFHAPDLCGPRWPADGSHRHPSRHQCCGQALQNHGQDTKDYHSWTW